MKLVSEWGDTTGIYGDGVRGASAVSGGRTRSVEARLALVDVGPCLGNVVAATAGLFTRSRWVWGRHVLSSSRRIRLVSRMLRLEQSRVSTSEGGGQLCADAAPPTILRSPSYGQGIERGSLCRPSTKHAEPWAILRRSRPEYPRPPATMYSRRFEPLLNQTIWVVSCP